MNSKNLLSVALLLMLAIGVKAQQHAIEFEEKTHDFGTVTQGDKTEHVFKFTNVSEQPIKLTTVKASCGCTTPKWTRDEIAPGETGEIKVTYNSNRVGPFNKSVRVMYDTIPTPVMIYIKGKVNAKPKEEVADGHEGHDHQPPPPSNIDYNIPRGALAFEKMIQNIKNITSEETQSVEFRFKNTSDKTVKILDIQGEDEFTVTASSRTLTPGMEAKLTVAVDGKKMKELGKADGYFSKRVSFTTDELGANSNKSMTINGNYKRIWSEAEKANSPRIEFVNREVDGGKVIEGEKFIYDFKFTNTGKTDLIIQSTKASCGCTASKPSAESIPPGQTAAITAEFNSQGRSGKQSKTITVKSNDVENPVVTLKFTVEVVKDPFHAGGMMGGSN